MRYLAWVLLALVALTVSVSRAADVRAAAVAQRPILYLDRGLGWGFTVNGKNNHSQLRREFVRQAFLLAAREELGWTTRNAWLGERPIDVQSDHLLDVVPLPGQPNTIEVLTGLAPRQRRREIIILPDAAAHDDGSEVELFERLSRQRFPQVLRKATGFEPVARPPWGSANLPDGIALQLDQMAFISQFAAVRAIHAAIAVHGQSPQLLAGLIRGYSHLGLMTEGQWNPSFRTYYARALLYAERWHTFEPNSPMALWHRAYAEAMAGFHNRTIRDLAAAEKLAASGSAGNPVKPPTWMPLIRRFVRFDLRALELKDDDPDAQLAALLIFVADQQANNVEMAIRQAGKALQLMPDCYRIHDDLARLSTRPTMERRMTIVTPKVFSATLYHNLAPVRGLPEKAAQIARPRVDGTGLPSGEEAADEQADRVRLIAALYDAGAAEDKGPDAAKTAGDRGSKSALADPSSATARPNQADGAEPGWETLAFWIEETGFQQIYERVVSIAATRRQDPSDYIDSVAPLIEHNRYQAAIDSFRFDETAKQAAIDKLKVMSFEEIDTRQFYLGTLFADTLHDDGDVWDCASSTMDDNANDISLMLSTTMPQYLARRAEQLLRYSPWNPNALAVMIELRWDQYKGHADDFLEMAKQHPRLALAFGQRAIKSKNYERAKTLFEQAVEQDPTVKSYGALARTYLLLGNMDMFQKTYDTYFKKIPSIHLNFASANNTIALCYIRRGQFEKAAPFAEKAAESWAAWAMLTKALVRASLNKFDEADKIYEAAAGNYGFGYSYYWLAFCLRTGHGNEAEARRLWNAYVKQMANHPALGYSPTFAVINALDGKADEAQAIFQHGFDRTGDPWLGICAAMEADRLGKAPIRDKLLAAVRERGGRFTDPATDEPRHNLLDLATLLIDNLKQKGNPPLDLAAAERICRQGDANQVQMAAFAVGEYLSHHGKMEDAERFWLHALDDPHSGEIQTEISGFRLKEAGVKPEDFEAARKNLGITNRWFSD